jgi:TP901 family phage tail tape measure protein
MAVRTASVVYVGDAASLIRASQQAAAATESATAKIAASNDKIAASHAKTVMAAQKAAEAFGKWGSITGVAVIGASVDMAMKVETAAAAIAKAGNTSTAAGKKIEDAFKNLGGLEYSAAKVGEAFATVAGELKSVEGRALNASKATEVMTAALNLADATGGELKGTTEALGKVMLTFGLHANKAAEASDILFTASKMTGLSVDTFTTMVDKARGRLGVLAPSLKDTSALMVELSKQGVTGRLTMGALGGAFGTLLSQSTKVKDQLKQLNVHVFNSKGAFVGWKSVIEQLQPALGKYNQASQLMATRTLFGEKASKQILALIHQGPAAFEAATRAVAKHAAAVEAAKKQHETLDGELKIAKAELANLSSDIGNELIPAFAKAAKALADGVKWLKEHNTAAKALAIVIGTVLGAAMVDFAVMKVAKFVGGIKTMISAAKLLAVKMGITAAAVTTADGEMVATTEAASVSMKAALMTTGIGAAVVALGLAAVALEGKWKPIMKSMAEVTEEAAEEMVKALNKVKEYLEIIAEGPLALRRLIPGLGGNAIPNIPGVASGKGYMGESTESFLRSHPNREPLGGSEKAMHSHASAQAAYLRKAGLPAVVAAGMAGNFANEGVATDTGKEGLGIGQWTGSRRTELEAFAKSTHRKITDEGAQLEFAAKELMGKFTAVFKAAAHARTPQEAALILAKGYEKPEPSTAHYKRREESAASAYGTGSLPETAAHKAAKHHATETYVDPFAGAHGLKQGRTDMGIDYTMTPGSPIGAIGAGRITNITKNWYKGQPLIEYELTSGSHKGQRIYVAEQINPNVKIGQHVRAGQRIATYAASGTGIEMGFGAGGGKTLAQGTTGYTEGQVTAAGKQFAKFVSSIGKTGSNISIAGQQFAEAVKRAEHLMLTSAQKASARAFSLAANATHAEALGFGVQAEGVASTMGVLTSKWSRHPQNLATVAGAENQKERIELLVKNDRVKKKYYERELKALQKEAAQWGKTRDYWRKIARHQPSPKAKKEALDKAAAYEAKVEQAQAAAKELKGTIVSTEAEIEEADAGLAALPGEVQSADLGAYQQANAKIDAEERAGILTPEQAKKAKEANANKALAGGYGPLSEEGILQIKGDLKEFSEATQEATNAMEAHTNALKESNKLLDEFNKASAGLLATENASLIKTLTDMMNGQIGGRPQAYGAGRGAFAGGAARY